MKICTFAFVLLACTVVLASPSLAAGDVQGRSTAGAQQGQTVLASAFPSSGIYLVTVDGGQIKELRKLSDSLPAEIRPESSAKVATTEAKAESGPYTSLVIDARSVGVDRAMSPKVRKVDGSEVWGTLSVTPDFAIENGIVGYATSMEMALKSSRCGKNPLVIKAVGKPVGGPTCDVLISDEDASRVLSEDAVGKFLNTCKVVFVVD